MKSAYSMRKVIVCYAVAMLISGANYAEESIPVDPMTGEALAQPIPEAAVELSAADELLERASYADALVAYIALIEKYPESKQSLLAFEGIQRADKAVSADPIQAGSVVEDLAVKLPSLSQLDSPFARYNVCAFYFLRGNFLKKAGRPDEAKPLYVNCCEGVLESMRDAVNSPYQVCFAGLYMAAAARVHWDQGSQGARDLADFTASLPACVSKWSSHYVLADYYLHEGANREMAERHLAAMLDPEQYAPVEESLKRHVASDWVKATMRWAQGYAQIEMGHYDAAIATFENVVTRFGEVKAPGMWGGAVGQWAAVTKPLAVKLKHPDQPAVAIGAYESYLQEHGGSDYAAFAHLELGNLYKTTGEYAKAKEHYYEALAAENHWEASQAAVTMLNEVNALQSAEK